MSNYIGELKQVDEYIGSNLVVAGYIGSNKYFDAYSDVTGNLPLYFNSRANHNLKNYQLYGSENGAGVQTENLFDKDNLNIVKAYISSNDAIVDYVTNGLIYVPVVTGETYTFLGFKRASSTFEIKWGITASIPANGVSCTRVGLLNQSSSTTVTITSGEAYLCVFLCGDSDYNQYGSVEQAIMNNAETGMIVPGSTAPASYIPYGYKIPLTNTSGVTENLFDKTAVTMGKMVRDTGEVNSVNRCYSDYIEIEEDTRYYATNVVGNQSYYAGVSYDENKNVINNFNVYGSATIVSNAFRTPVNAKYIRINTAIDDVDTCMITKGSTAPSEYIPHRYTADYNLYIGPTKLGAEEYADFQDQKVWKQFEITGLSEPLCGIGEYKDTLDLSTGTVSRYIKKLILTGTENWVAAGTNLYFRLSIGAMNTVLNSYDLFCTHFVTASISSASTAIGAAVYNSGTSNAAMLNIRPSDITTTTAFKQFLANEYANGTPVTVWYVLTTPTTETVTVPTGLTGIVEGYMSQSSIPTQTSPIYPAANGEKQPNDTYFVLTLQPTDPPSSLPAITAYQGENTLSSTETMGEVTVRGRISAT